MAETFKNAFYSGSGIYGLRDLYTAPTSASNVSIVLGLQYTATGSEVGKVSAALKEASGSTVNYFASNIILPVGTAVNLVSGKLILEYSDKIQIVSSNEVPTSVVLSVLEIT